MLIRSKLQPVFFLFSADRMKKVMKLTKRLQIMVRTAMQVEVAEVLIFASLEYTAQCIASCDGCAVLLLYVLINTF